MTCKKVRALAEKKSSALSKQDWLKAKEACQRIIDLHLKDENLEDEIKEWKDMLFIAQRLHDQRLEVTAHRY